jgi:hypothetical protein
MVARHPTRTVLIAGGAAAVLIGGITAFALSDNSGSKPVATGTPTPRTSASPTPTPTPTPAPSRTTKPAPKRPAVNPLTGVGPAPSGPVVAVKIDDTDNGRPSVGLEQADVVYIEQAEGGLTRMLAVFGTNKPTVEAVRSVRASDAELLGQYGPIALVASGGGGDSLPTLDKSILRGVINDRGGPGFFRDGGRSAPYNLGANLSQVATATRTAAARDVGFRWAAHDPRLLRATRAGAVNTVVGGTPVTFRWDLASHRYLRTINGSVLHVANGSGVSTPNVLVQLCRVSTNPADVDVAGNPSQYTHSVGSGRAVLFRDGRRIEGTWKRATAASPTSFVDRRGTPLTLAPGGAYVVLASTGAPV